MEIHFKVCIIVNLYHHLRNSKLKKTKNKPKTEKHPGLNSIRLYRVVMLVNRTRSIWTASAYMISYIDLSMTIANFFEGFCKSD